MERTAILEEMERACTHVPRGVSRRFAATLNAATRPFHEVNYVSALGGGRVLRRDGMERLFDHTITHLPALSRCGGHPTRDPRPGVISVTMGMVSGTPRRDGGPGECD